MTLQVTRRDFAGPIDVSVAGPPGVSGIATIPAGQNAGLLVLTASADMPMAPHRLELVAKANLNNHLVVERVHIRPIISQAMNNLPYPPPSLVEQLAVAVTEKLCSPKVDVSIGDPSAASPTQLTTAVSSEHANAASADPSLPTVEPSSGLVIVTDGSPPRFTTGNASPISPGSSPRWIVSP